MSSILSLKNSSFDLGKSLKRGKSDFCARRRWCVQGEEPFPSFKFTNCRKEYLGWVILKFAKMFEEKFTKCNTNWEKTNTCKEKNWEHAWRRFENPIGIREELNVLVRSGMSLKSSRMQEEVAHDCNRVIIAERESFIAWWTYSEFLGLS